jgi:hypothetical protein
MEKLTRPRATPTPPSISACLPMATPLLPFELFPFFRVKLNMICAKKGDKSKRHSRQADTVH